jgi:hypothetical protein
MIRSLLKQYPAVGVDLATGATKIDNEIRDDPANESASSRV